MPGQERRRATADRNNEVRPLLDQSFTQESHQPILVVQTVKPTEVEKFDSHLDISRALLLEAPLESLKCLDDGRLCRG
jgi:hypothetical protein